MDKTHTNDYSIGAIRETKNYGKYEIIEKLDKVDQYRYNFYRIRFIDTGYMTIVSAKNMIRGTIKDPYRKIILGVACMGIIKDPYEIYERDYKRWHDMIRRCYDPNYDQYYTYGGAGVRVCERWLCFEYYYEDIKNLPGYADYKKDPHTYQMDKDILQSNTPKDQMVHSPQTCMYIPRRLNLLMNSNTIDPYIRYMGVDTYFGKDNKFQAKIIHNNHKFIIGVYSTPELAAGAYNYFISTYYPYMPLNPVRTLTMYEVADLDLRKNKYEMCRIINKVKKDQGIAAKDYLFTTGRLQQFLDSYNKPLVEMCTYIIK